MDCVACLLANENINGNSNLLLLCLCVCVCAYMIRRHCNSASPSIELSILAWTLVFPSNCSWKRAQIAHKTRLTRTQPSLEGVRKRQPACAVGLVVFFAVWTVAHDTKLTATGSRPVGRRLLTMRGTNIEKGASIEGVNLDFDVIYVALCSFLFAPHCPACCQL